LVAFGGRLEGRKRWEECWFLFVVDGEGGVGMAWINGNGPVWVVAVVLWLFAFVVVAQAFRWLLVG
jgi:hypothetical protein